MILGLFTNCNKVLFLKECGLFCQSPYHSLLLSQGHLANYHLVEWWFS
jgi:hypothetical protein